MTPSSTSQRHKPHFSLKPTEQSEPGQVRVKRPRRRWRWLAGLAVAMVAVVWLLPMLVAHSPMLNWVVARAAADLNGTVAVGSASLGWFSPIGASQIEVRDAKGQPVLTVDQATGDASLLGILWNTARLGNFRLEKPKLQVVLTPQGSNVEDLIAKYLADPSGEPLSIGLEIVDGTVAVQDPGGRSWTIEQLQLSLRTSAEGNRPLELAAKGVIPDGNTPGSFDVALKMDAASNMVLTTKTLAIEKLEGILARCSGNAKISGRLTSRVECRWGGDAGAMHILANAEASPFSLVTPLLKTDRVQMQKLKADCKLTWQSGKIAVEQAKIDSDLGNVALTGEFALGGADVGGAFDSFLRQTYHAQGRIDLACLATMLPETLHIHKETRVSSGELTVDLDSRRGQDGMSWKANVRTSDLTAMRQNKELVWQQPIVLTLDARESKDGPVIDSLKCESHFLTINAAGRREDLAASLEFDLDRLVERLGGFIDLDGLKMEGKGWANLNWRRDRQNAFTLDANAQVRNLQLALSDRPPWQEEKLVVFLASTGRTTFGTDTRLDTAELEVKAGSEQLRLRLTQPVDGLKPDGSWPLALDTSGELARWIVRARAWKLLDDWDAAGAYRLAAEGTASASGVALRSSKLDVEKFRMVGHGLNLIEPSAALSAAGQYLHGDRRMLVSKAELNTATLTVNASDVIVGVPDGKAMELAGNVSYRGDLARLRQWIAEPSATPTWNVGGQITGEARLKQVVGVTTGRLDATVRDLVFQSASGKQLREPTVQLAALGTYDQPSRMLKIEQFKVTSDALSGDAKGRVAELGAGANAQLTGKLDYDMEKLATLLRPYLGGGVYLAGRGSRPFSLNGPIDLAQATASAGADWSGAYVYGFRVGPGELKMGLAGGILQIEPLDLPVSEGRVHLVSRMRLAPGPMELDVDPGPLVQQVRIDPDMCAYALQYIAPVLAGVATAQGKFSIDLDSCRIPIDNPGQGDLAGRFTVHSVEIGPGPLTRELAAVLARESAAKLTRESVIQFRMVDGKVYHEGLELVFPELTVRTRGWVGLDQSMSIVAEMPIPPKWLSANNAVGDALRNQTVVLPIGGTLGRPQIDRQKLNQYTQQFVRKAAEKAIQGEVNRQLDRLLRPR